MTIDALKTYISKIEEVCPHCYKGWELDDYMGTKFQCRFCCGTTLKDFAKLESPVKSRSYERAGHI